MYILVKAIPIERMKHMIRINSTQQINQIAYHNLNNKKNPNKNNPHTETTTVSISNEARNKYRQSLQLKEVTPDHVLGRQFQKSFEEFHGADAVEKRRLEQLEKEEALRLSIQVEFPENTIHHTIKKTLKAKAVNESVYAIELATALRSSISMPEKSLTERAAYREVALKQAEYIAANYFDDEQEAAAFMDEVKRYYENDILREKGFIVFDNSDLRPFRNYSSPSLKDNEVSFSAFAEKYGDDKTSVSATFLMDIEMKRTKYTNEITNEFAAKNKQAEETIAATKSLIESLKWQNGIPVETTEYQPGYLVEILEWNKKMLELLI